MTGKGRGRGRGRGRGGPLSGDIFCSCGRGIMRRDGRGALTTFKAKDNASEVYSTPATEKIHEEDEDFERMIADITRTEEEIDRMIAEMEVEEAELEAIEKKFCEQQKGKKAEAAARAA